MTSFIIVKYLHVLGFMVLFACLVAEHLAIKPSMPRAELRRLAIVDGIYGGSAVLVLVTGFLLWLSVGKPAAFYSSNPILHIKITLFVLVGLISIYPTVFFLKNRNTELASVDIPKAILMCVRAELALMLVIPLLAVLMAQGIGL